MKKTLPSGCERSERSCGMRLPRDAGQFSLAGEPKTALLYENGRWGVPSGRMPTTHILKPPTGDYDGHAENQHVCMQLAAALGLATAGSQVLRFEDQVAIVVARYDRQRTDAGIVRVHQEDMCQALGILPTAKYENEGGRGARADRRSHQNILHSGGGDALAFNWLIGGTDAHAKNYSMLIGAHGRARLAPLYDIASILPYDFDPQKIRSAMKIGAEYRIRDIGPYRWRRLATDLRLDADAVGRAHRRACPRSPRCTCRCAANGERRWNRPSARAQARLEAHGESATLRGCVRERPADLIAALRCRATS